MFTINNNIVYKLLISGIICLAFCVLIPANAISAESLKVTPYVSYGSDGIVDVINNITYGGKISAIAIKVDLPDGLEFVSVNADSQPAIKPKKGDTGLLEFAWIMPPSSPFTFTYTVQAFDKVMDKIQSQVIYRRSGGALTTNIEPIEIK